MLNKYSIKLRIVWTRKRNRVLILSTCLLLSLLPILGLIIHQYSVGGKPAVTYERPSWVFPMSRYVTDGRMHQHYIYDTKKAYAEAELGECAKLKINICFSAINVRHGGGPRKVLNNLMSGLREIGVSWAYCDPKLEDYDVTFLPDMEWITDSNRTLLYEEWKGSPRVILGPNIDFERIRLNDIPPNNIKAITILGASKWHAMSQLRAFGQGMDHAVRWWPVGVDTHCFSPSKPMKSRKKIVTYQKRAAITESVFSMLEKRGFPRHDPLGDMKSDKNEHIYINYGEYVEQDFMEYMKETEISLIFGVRETEGLAYLEMMAMDVPLIFIGEDTTSYFDPSCGLVVKHSDELPDALDKMVELRKQGKLTPRKWIVDNISLHESALDLMRVFCGKKTRWD